MLRSGFLSFVPDSLPLSFVVFLPLLFLHLLSLPEKRVFLSQSFLQTSILTREQFIFHLILKLYYLLFYCPPLVLIVCLTLFSSSSRSVFLCIPRNLVLLHLHRNRRLLCSQDWLRTPNIPTPTSKGLLMKRRRETWRWMKWTVLRAITTATTTTTTTVSSLTSTITLFPPILLQKTRKSIIVWDEEKKLHHQLTKKTKKKKKENLLQTSWVEMTSSDVT